MSAFSQAPSSPAAHWSWPSSLRGRTDARSRRRVRTRTDRGAALLRISLGGVTGRCRVRMIDSTTARGEQHSRHYDVDVHTGRRPHRGSIGQSASNLGRLEHLAAGADDDDRAEGDHDGHHTGGCPVVEAPQGWSRGGSRRRRSRLPPCRTRRRSLKPSSTRGLQVLRSPGNTGCSSLGSIARSYT